MADENEIPKIRTLKTDVEEFAREHKTSPLDIAAKSYAQKDWTEKIVPTFSRIRVFLIAIALILVIGIGYFALQFFQKTPEIIKEQQTPIGKFLPVEDEQTLAVREINPGSLTLALLNETQKARRNDTVVYFPAEIETRLGETKTLYAADFIKFANFNPPADFSKNLLPEFNALAIYGTNGGNLGIIFKVKKFEDALSSLLSWEAKMWLDFKPFLRNEDIQNIGQFSWADDIIQNNDARVLKNSPPAGGAKIILGYSIFNKQYVIISTSRDALSTILERLIALPPR